MTDSNCGDRTVTASWLQSPGNPFLSKTRYRKHSVSFGSFFVALLLLAGCGTMKGYEGESLPQDEIAWIEWSGGPGGIRVKSLNGELPGLSTRAEVLPGDHLVNITYTPNMGLTTYSKTLSFEVEPGHRYELHAACGTWVSCEPFWVWLEDMADSRVVAGINPQ